MTRNTRHSLWPRPSEPGRRHGTAMMEAVLCVPLIALVLGLTFFFGWGMRNQQHVIISDRYAAWRLVLAKDAVGGGWLDQKFFGERAGSVTVDFGGGPKDTLKEYVLYAGHRGAPVEALARSLVLQRFPGGISAEVSAEFPPDAFRGVWSMFPGELEQTGGGEIKRRHVREGVEWRNKEAALERQVRDQFFVPLDTALLSIPAPGDGLGRAFQKLYIRRWNARP